MALDTDLALKFEKWLHLVTNMHSEFHFVGNPQAAWATVDKPLSQMRIGLLSTAGVHLKSQEPFNLMDHHGDWSRRLIPADVNAADLMATHSHYDTAAANALESAGIPTVAVAVRPEVIWGSKVPRAAYLRFPTGNPIGEAHHPEQQLAILTEVLRCLRTITEPGTIVELPFRWRKMTSVSGSGLYGAALTRVESIKGAYEHLADTIIDYIKFLDEEIAVTQAQSEPPEGKLIALQMQRKGVARMLEHLETATLDDLIRFADRVVRIKHWEDGVFL